MHNPDDTTTAGRQIIGRIRPLALIVCPFDPESYFESSAHTPSGHASTLTVARSPHSDKKSHESFEQRTHKRLLDIIEPTAKTVDELKKLNLPAGVDITIKI